jgi:polar amino acid transport system permease protein
VQDVLQEIAAATPLVLNGAVTSLWLFFFSLIGSVILGVGVCALRMCRLLPVRLLIQFYISVLRGTPLMLQLFVVYFGPYFIFGLSIPPEFQNTAALVAFILNYAAYFAEIYRTGMISIPKGQYAAAIVLGYGKLQTFFRIILPQVVKRILPAMSNEVINLVKDTSLAFAIGLTEMFFVAKSQANAYSNVYPYLIAAIVYYLFNLLIAFIMNRVEKKMDYYHE